MRAKGCDLPTVSADACLRVDGAEPCEQIARARQSRSGRRVQPFEITRVAYSPSRKVECERRKIRVQYLRWRVRRKTPLRLRAPRAIAHTGREPPCSALALLGRCARNTLRIQPAHASCRIKHQAAHQSRINNDAYALDCETGLGNIGRENHFARARRTDLERRILLRASKITEQGEDPHARSDAARFQQRLHALDLTRAGQEGEHIARFFDKSGLHQACDQPLRCMFVRGRRPGQRRRPASCIARLHRIEATGCFNDGRLQQSSETLHVKRR
jgi:hypothetical protein